MNQMPPALVILGHTHLLLLHFPIAGVFALLFGELLLRKKVPVEKREEVTGMLLVIAAAGAVIATVTGLIFASSEEWRGHTETMLMQHRNGGIVASVLTVGAFAAFKKMRAAYLPLLLAAAVVVTLTGHRGGDLVHGEGYLWNVEKDDEGGKKDDDTPDVVASSDGDEAAPEARQRWPEGQIVDKPTYAKDIKPLLDRSCVKCHGPEKRKGGLRLDKKRYAMKGGETGAAIVPGNIGESLLIKYITLSPDDEDIMPSKGKLLANSEVETLKKWIEQGAEWPDDEGK
jgi:uncharacterized membrane protein/mono/diheme cytochrome c family protein